MQGHNHDGNPVVARVVTARSRAGEAGIASSDVGTMVTGDEIVRKIMRLNSQAIAEMPGLSNESLPPVPVLVSNPTPIPPTQITTANANPGPDPGLITSTFFVTRKTGNTCIVCSPCDITLDNSFTHRKHKASVTSAVSCAASGMNAVSSNSAVHSNITSNPTHYTGTLIDNLDYNKFITLLGIEHGYDRDQDPLGSVEEDVHSPNGGSRCCTSLETRGSRGLRWRV